MLPSLRREGAGPADHARLAGPPLSRGLRDRLGTAVSGPRPIRSAACVSVAARTLLAGIRRVSGSSLGTHGRIHRAGRQERASAVGRPARIRDPHVAEPGDFRLVPLPERSSGSRHCRFPRRGVPGNGLGGGPETGRQRATRVGGSPNRGTLVLQPGIAVDLQTVAENDSAFRIYGRPAGDGRTWTLHAQGRLRRYFDTIPFGKPHGQ